MSAIPIDSDENERQPNLVRDIAAIALVAITLILVVSVVTRSAADPIDEPMWPINQFYSPDVVVYPANASITNACGYWGALLSSMLFDAVGLASSLVIAGLGGVATALLIRGHLNAPVLRSLGGTITVLGAATAAGLSQTSIEGMPIVGSGGYLGAMTSTWLLEHFAPAGGWILTLTTLAVGLLITTDYALLYAGKKIVAKGAGVSRAGMQRAAGVLPAKRLRQPFTDLEEPITLDGESGEASAEESAAAALDVIDPDKPDANERHDGPKIKFNRTKRTGIAGAVAATAAGLAAAASDALSPSAPTESDEEVSDEYDEGDWDEEEEEEEVAEAPTREIEVEGEQLILRQDEAHPVSEPASQPKIRAPKQKSKRDPREEFLKTVKESAPNGFEDYQLPPLELLRQSDDISYDDQLEEVRRKAHILEKTFKEFNFNIRVVEIETGPVIAQYEIELEAGLRLSKITGLSEDLAIALRVPSVRIVAPIPGKNTVGIEVPNETRQVVMLRDVIEESDTRSAKMNIPVFLGKDVSGNPMVVDLAKMPHLLIAGRTGTGKSVCLNTIISSILMCCRPDEVRMLMIDPKMVELSGYGRLPHLMHPVITDMRKAEAILAWAVEKMEERYSLLAKAGVRHINSFNDLGREEILRRMEIDEEDGETDVPDKLPFIVIIADEMADLMMTAGKDVETHIIRLAQKSRAVGIHLILATQKPTVDVITGLIKSNLPARLSFQVASKTDSRVVLDENGADKLLGNGDMLFLWPGTSTLIRGQGTYLSDDEIDAVCAHCSQSEQNFVGELMELKVDAEGDGGDGTSMEAIKKRDELYDSAIEVVIREGRGSCSLLQRCLGIGYGRAAKLIDFMAEDGIVGEYNGSKAREVVMTMAKWNSLQGLDEDDGQVDDNEEEYDEDELESGDEEDDDEYEEVDEDAEEEYEDAE
ncbi:DNA translocase FtsK [Rubripirellula reticaptiva]|uniref:DNA translocase FtsK n=1 Tax=Rubripirellula reticaptiva TaxID=2528013 RepID=A0A5C6EEU4_9BACT|nr:DNA translocase FtsK [Rubripirellula reticaptiva]TWU48283.1 DNA translocase FtsK [Rubripirellula reticaptiva]